MTSDKCLARVRRNSLCSEPLEPLAGRVDRFLNTDLELTNDSIAATVNNVIRSLCSVTDNSQPTDQIKDVAGKLRELVIWISNHKLLSDTTLMHQEDVLLDAVISLTQHKYTEQDVSRIRDVGNLCCCIKAIQRKRQLLDNVMPEQPESSSSSCIRSVRKKALELVSSLAANFVDSCNSESSDKALLEKQAIEFALFSGIVCDIRDRAKFVAVSRIIDELGQSLKDTATSLFDDSLLESVVGKARVEMELQYLSYALRACTLSIHANVNDSESQLASDVLRNRLLYFRSTVNSLCAVIEQSRAHLDIRHIYRAVRAHRHIEEQIHIFENPEKDHKGRSIVKEGEKAKKHLIMLAKAFSIPKKMPKDFDDCESVLNLVNKCIAVSDMSYQKETLDGILVNPREAKSRHSRQFGSQIRNTKTLKATLEYEAALDNIALPCTKISSDSLHYSRIDTLVFVRKPMTESAIKSTVASVVKRLRGVAEQNGPYHVVAKSVSNMRLPLAGNSSCAESLVEIVRVLSGCIDYIAPSCNKEDAIQSAIEDLCKCIKSYSAQERIQDCTGGGSDNTPNHCATYWRNSASVAANSLVAVASYANDAKGRKLRLCALVLASLSGITGNIIDAKSKRCILRILNSLAETSKVLVGSAMEDGTGGHSYSGTTGKNAQELATIAIDVYSQMIKLVDAPNTSISINVSSVDLARLNAFQASCAVMATSELLTKAGLLRINTAQAQGVLSALEATLGEIANGQGKPAEIVSRICSAYYSTTELNNKVVADPHAPRVLQYLVEGAMNSVVEVGAFYVKRYGPDAALRAVTTPQQNVPSHLEGSSSCTATSPRRVYDYSLVTDGRPTKRVSFSDAAKVRVISSNLEDVQVSATGAESVLPQPTSAVQPWRTLVTNSGNSRQKEAQTLAM